MKFEGNWKKLNIDINYLIHLKVWILSLKLAELMNLFLATFSKRLFLNLLKNAQTPRKTQNDKKYQQKK